MSSIRWASVSSVRALGPALHNAVSSSAVAAASAIRATIGTAQPVSSAPRSARATPGVGASSTCGTLPAPSGDSVIVSGPAPAPICTLGANANPSVSVTAAGSATATAAVTPKAVP